MQARTCRRWGWVVAVLLAWGALAPGAFGQVGSDPLDEPEPPVQPLPPPDDAPENVRDLKQAVEKRREAGEYQRRAMAAFNVGDYEAAEGLFRRQLELEPRNYMPLYNLACTRAMLGDAAEAEELLKRAIECGFIDQQTLLTDPNLSILRGSPFFESVLRSWQAIVAANAEARLEGIRAKYGPRYLYEQDESLRLSFAIGYDQETMDAVREETRRLTAWALAEVFDDLVDPPMGEEDPWAFVVLPNEKDFQRWALVNYGPESISGDTHRLGGAYNHDRKELVAMDLGGTFRHEFFHALHWRSNARLGRMHPAWVQEGLCCLVEDYDLRADGTLVITPSWRTNLAKRMELTGKLEPIDEFVRTSRETFTSENPLAKYAHARALFLFLYQKGKLRAWYEAFDASYQEDPYGAGAFERVFNKPIDEVSKDFRAWLRALPEVAEARSDGSIRGLSASLGCEVDPGKGEGPVVLAIRAAQARRAGLKVNDVITSVDGRPTRDINEFIRVMGEYAPGAQVKVGVRRRKEHLELTIVLTPYQR